MSEREPTTARARAFWAAARPSSRRREPRHLPEVVRPLSENSEDRVVMVLPGVRRSFGQFVPAHVDFAALGPEKLAQLLRAQAVDV